MGFQGLSTIGLAGALLVGLLVVVEAFYRLGRWRQMRRANDSATGGNDVALTSILAILGLVLAFTYSAAVQRYDARKAAVIDEANALSTAFLRAELAPDPIRSELRSALLTYAQSRLFSYEEVSAPERLRTRLTQTAVSRSALWPLVVRLSREPGVPVPVQSAVMQSINQVLDMDTRRFAAAFDRLPAAILGLLMFLAGVAMGLAGYQAGIAGRLHRWRMSALAAVLAVLIAFIVDYDRALRGFIVVPQTSIESVVTDMHRALE